MGRPRGEHRAGDAAAGGAVGLVVLAIDAEACLVVGDDGVDRRRVVNRPAEVGAEAPRPSLSFGSRRVPGVGVAVGGVDNAGAIEGLKMIVDLINAGVSLPKGSTQSVTEQKLSSGELATMVNGPWAWVKPY